MDSSAHSQTNPLESGALVMNSPWQVRFFKFVRVVLLLAVFIAADVVLFRYFSQVHSQRGFINGKLYSVRTPIQGELALKRLYVGQSIEKNQLLGTVDNKRTESLTLQREDLVSRIRITEEKAQHLQGLLGNRGSFLGQLSKQAGVQKNLRLQYESEKSSRYQQDVKELESTYKLAEANATRYRNLAQKGYTSQAMADQYETAAQQAKAALDSRKNQAGEARTQLAAAKAGVQVEGAQTASYADMRGNDIRLEMLKLQHELADLTAESEQLKSQLAQLDAQLELLAHANLTSPVSGVVWSVDATTGEYLEEAMPVVKLLSCQNTWVDTFVDEKDIAKIDMTAPVQLKLAGDQEMPAFKGHVQAVRSGRGKYVVDQQDEILPPNNKTESQTLIRIAFDWPEKMPSTRESCGVGSTVTAVFAKRNGKGGHDKQLASRQSQ